MNNTYRKFSNQLNSNINTKFSDLISDKNTLVHIDLYNDALSSMQAEKNYTTYSYTFTEITGTYFDSPSSVIVTEKQYPFKQKIIDLTPYWKTYQFNADKMEIKLDEYTIQTSEVIYKDYINGKAIIQSKYTGIQTVVDLNAIPDYMPISDKLSRKSTFGYKLENNLSE